MGSKAEEERWVVAGKSAVAAQQEFCRISAHNGPNRENRAREVNQLRRFRVGTRCFRSESFRRIGSL